MQHGFATQRDCRIEPLNVEGRYAVQSIVTVFVLLLVFYAPFLRMPWWSALGKGKAGDGERGNVFGSGLTRNADSIRNGCIDMYVLPIAAQLGGKQSRQPPPLQPQREQVVPQSQQSQQSQQQRGHITILSSWPALLPSPSA